MINTLKKIFEERFKKVPRAFQAPGRINLIGEHTDYNDGFVLPAAIDKSVKLLIALNTTDSCNVIAKDEATEVSFSVNDLKPSNDWSTYVKGVVYGFQQLNCKPQGFDAIFSSNIPIGAGLSSSAALSCSFAFAINELFNFGLNKLQLAKIAQQAEHNFAGVKCGIMDQYASLFGKKDSVLLLDCRSLTHQYFPIALKDHALLLVDSKVKHSLASTAYNKRRASCEEAVHIIQQDNPQVKSLRHVDKALLKSYQQKIPAESYQRSSFIVGEIERTQQAATLLQENNLKAFGACMYETHEGLSKVYEVSCAELDVLVDIAKQHEVTGARMMGGGFGGCTINLIANDKVEKFKEAVMEIYQNTFKVTPAFYQVAIEDGVHEIVNA
jgi:galactokinase